MERRAFLAMPLPSPDNCQWCGFSLSRGQHGIMKGVEAEDKIGVQCLVPFDVTSENVPRFDVVSGTGLMKFSSTVD